jgi:hypothetical protein
VVAVCDGTLLSLRDLWSFFLHILVLKDSTTLFLENWYKGLCLKFNPKEGLGEAMFQFVFHIKPHFHVGSFVGILHACVHIHNVILIRVLYQIQTCTHKRKCM